jgi:hypothetical protein
MPSGSRRNADDALLMALACGATVESAARSAGVSEATAHRRLAEPEFKRRMLEFRAEVMQRTAGSLTAASQEAVRTLLALQKDGVAPSVRLGAARAVLEIGMKVREVAELEVQLDELRQKVEALGGRDGPA